MIYFRKNQILPIFLTFMLIFSAVFQFSAEAKSQLKVAVVAPEGSTWMNILREWDKELKKKTNGSVGFKFYASGSMGDEKTVIKKIRSGQLHGGAFTGVGLGEIVPEVRLMELPFMFKNSTEVDYVLDNMNEFYDKEFEKKGYVNLGWAETGFVYIFANKPIKTMNDMRGVKMWMWEGDELVEELFKTLNLVPTPLSLTDVLTSLQSNLIDGVYGPPVGAIAMQWHTKVKYMVSQKMAYATGAMLISKKAWDDLSAEEQKTLKETADKYSKKLVSSVRADNEKAISSIKSSGIKIIDADDSTVEQLQEVSKKVSRNLAGKLYPAGMLNKVFQLKKQAGK